MSATTKRPPDYLSPAALDWALTHIERYSDADFFPKCFEFQAIRFAWADLKVRLQQYDLSDFRPGASRRLVVPKPGGDFRIAAQLDPIDTLLYTGMIFEAANNIEDSRISVEQKVACSYRLDVQSDGQLFPPESGWDDFHGRSTALAGSGQYQFVLTADISDFYNQVSQHRVENELERARIDSVRAKNIEELLNKIAAKHSRGLPVGPAASIVLAEACLNDVDLRLISKGLAHTRYVDDYRVFCTSRSEAISCLQDLTEYLYTSHRLSFNPTKTEILSIHDFMTRELPDPAEHERDRESELLQEEASQLVETGGGYGAFAEDEDLTELLDDKVKVKALRRALRDTLDRSLDGDRVKLGWARHALRRATALRTGALVETVVANLPQLASAFREVVGYLKSVPKKATENKMQIVDFLRNDDYGKLPYCKIWGVDLITHNPRLAAQSEAYEIASGAANGLRTRLIADVALAYNQFEWIREHKETWANNGPWARRALIRAASVLPKDERTPWLNVVAESNDILDSAVARWVASSTPAQKKGSATVRRSRALTGATEQS